MEEFIIVVFSFGVICGIFGLIAYLRVRAVNKPMDDFYKRQEIKQREIEKQKNIEKALENDIEYRRVQYAKSSSATINHYAFLNSDKPIRSKMFSDYLLTACEENISYVTKAFLSVCPDKKHVESEVAAYFQFIGITLMQSTNLYELDFFIDFSASNEEKNRDAARFENRVEIYYAILAGSPLRAYWDPSGNIVKNNSNDLISCLMTMSDFIWEPGLRDSTSYDEYINHPITIKSIDKAMEFQRIYADVNMQVALFMDMVAGTAQRLGILPMQ